MTAPTRPQVGGYALSPAALRDAGLLGVTVQDIGRALANPVDQGPIPLRGGHCSTIGAYGSDKRLRLVLHPTTSVVDRVLRA